MVTLHTDDILIFGGMNGKLLQKIYFLKNAKRNNRDLNRDWIKPKTYVKSYCNVFPICKLRYNWYNKNTELFVTLFHHEKENWQSHDINFNLRVHWRHIFGNAILCSTLQLGVYYFIYFKCIVRFFCLKHRKKIFSSWLQFIRHKTLH